MDIFDTTITDWVGYAAMVVLLISFMLKNVRKLRIINTLGCALFVLYGVLLSTSWPIVISNVAIICINFYYLFVKKN